MPLDHHIGLENIAGICLYPVSRTAWETAGLDPLVGQTQDISSKTLSKDMQRS